ncbi:MAG TPA: hypothetical protein VH481_05825 [Nitrososphaeraceae archaeon]
MKIRLFSCVVLSSFIYFSVLFLYSNSYINLSSYADETNCEDKAFKKYLKKGEKPFEKYLDKADDVPLPSGKDDVDEYLDKLDPLAKDYINDLEPFADKYIEDLEDCLG